MSFFLYYITLLIGIRIYIYIYIYIFFLSVNSFYYISLLIGIFFLSFRVILRHAHDEFQLVANSWRYSQGYSNKLYFSLVDFDEGPDVFQQVS